MSQRRGQGDACFPETGAVAPPQWNMEQDLNAEAESAVPTFYSNYEFMLLSFRDMTTATEPRYALD